MAPPHLVCSEIDPPPHSCPAAQNTGQTCIFPSEESGSKLSSYNHSVVLIKSSTFSTSFRHHRTHLIYPGTKVCQSQGDEFTCSTADPSINATCDKARCPLQGTPMAPTKETQILTGCAEKCLGTSLFKENGKSGNFSHLARLSIQNDFCMPKIT